MKHNKLLNKQIIETVNNQLRNNEPPETKITYQRLLDQGIPKERAKELIGVVLTAEIYDVLKKNEPFDKSRYEKMLNMLPDTNFLDEI